MPVKQIPIFDFDRVFGPPPGFEYPTEISSQISATEAFETGIDKRDICCVICGATFEKTLDLTYIVPRDERDLWRDLKRRKFVPWNAKSQAHETRNGILLCATHYRAFDGLAFYIRFFPSNDEEPACYALINYSRHPDFEKFHNKSLKLDPFNSRTPIPGAFLAHEGCVRGYWWLRQKGDRMISHPILPQDWIGAGNEGRDDQNAGNTDSDDHGEGDTHHEGHDIANGEPSVHKADEDVTDPKRETSAEATSSSPQPNGPRTQNRTLRGPYEAKIPLPSDPGFLKMIKAESRALPSWKAMEIEGETWDGTADENATKWRRIMGVTEDAEVDVL